MFSNIQRKIALATAALVFTLSAVFASANFAPTQTVEADVADSVEVAGLFCSVFGICFGF